MTFHDKNNFACKRHVKMLTCVNSHAWIQLKLVACEGRAAGAPDILQASSPSRLQTLTLQLNASALSGYSLASSCSVLMHCPSNSPTAYLESVPPTHTVTLMKLKLAWDQLFTFTFMHLADAFIQSDLHCIQVTVFTFYQLLLSLGIEPMILALLAPCSTIELQESSCYEGILSN